MRLCIPGYAYQKRPVIIFRTDFRTGEQPGKAPYNLMLAQSATIQIPPALFIDTESLSRKIRAELDRCLATAHHKRPRVFAPAINVRFLLLTASAILT